MISGRLCSFDVANENHPSMRVEILRPKVVFLAREGDFRFGGFDVGRRGL